MTKTGRAARSIGSREEEDGILEKVTAEYVESRCDWMEDYILEIKSEIIQQIQFEMEKQRQVLEDYIKEEIRKVRKEWEDTSSRIDNELDARSNTDEEIGQVRDGLASREGAHCKWW